MECDNEFERAILASAGMDFATWKANRPPVFLVSVAMWANYLRHLAQDLAVRDLAARAGDNDAAIHRTLNGLRRWRYVTVEPAPQGRRSRLDDLVRLTAAGRRCVRVWQPLPDLVEARWRRRLGDRTVSELRHRLAALLADRGDHWPYCMPIVSSRREMFSEPTRAVYAGPAVDRPLLALLSQALLAFTLEFERESPMPLPVAGNALRVLSPQGAPERGTALRDLPQHAGISAAATAQSLTLLRRHGLAVVAADTTGQRRAGRRVHLTRSGAAAQEDARKLVLRIERRWHRRFGAAAVTATHHALDRVIGDGSPGKPPLAAALAAPPGTWRSAAPTPTTLPHHPMPLGRGGWPDGA